MSEGFRSGSERDRGQPVERVGAEERLYSLTQIRHLTKVEYARSARYDYPLTCMLVAIDGLSALRDRAGYDAKEAALGELIELLRANTRVCDYLGRLVDERLLAVMPHTAAAGAAVCAQRLVQLASGSRGRFTISVGWAERTKDLPYFDQLLEKAEAALARAEAAGGNRSVGAHEGARS
ncbi:MAG: diguanylate cyclase [Planctomycetes bacterium]|nr:diguanylate cyclase [Planctomycetota bacterium]